MEEDGTCRNNIADKAELSPLLESLIGATDGERFKIINFFSELIKLNRRTFNEQILHIIKEEGPFSTMHTLLIYLQTALQDQCPVMAGLLLQLDLLVEPRKMSIYREEAMDTLISCLRNTDFPVTQLAAADTIMSLQGSFDFSGNPRTREVLLKRAGIDKSSRSLIQVDQISNFSPEIDITPEEEKAADDWERRIASILVSHEFGTLFEALADGMKSRNPELRSACFVSATWLIYMLTILPDTGIQVAARACLLKQFIAKLNSAKDVEDRILSMLALNSFLHFSDGLGELTSYTKDILKGLRELKRSCPLASKMLKVLVAENESKADIWIHKELIKEDCSENGEVLSVICFKDKFFSGHTDGTIKVWTLKDNLFHLLQEIQEHIKAVTNLVISESDDRLYSGSLDRTAKVWSIGKVAIHCVQVHDMKDQIHNLVVTNSLACFIPQGTGVKVQSLNGESKLLNSSKYVKCLAHVHGKLYCGCHDSSVQEIHLATGTVSAIQSGSRRLLGKANPIHALQIHGELIYAAGSSFDGSAIKIWNNSNYSMVGSLQTGSEVRAMAVGSELIYLGCKGGTVEIWDKKKQNRVDTLQMGTNCRVNCMALDSNEEVLVIGTSDGQIQAWGMN
ncbi:putative E3 ubiquitin-protein ligase LIN-1 [Spatholobus suberectus]|nr:putative E3 ubiquitin-protein ligase LIN-1 [Spatholobus suberectus]